jgi:hypothetical protein
MREALRLTAQNLSMTDEERMRIPDLYPAWKAGTSYAAGAVVGYGTDERGKTQLYAVLQGHTSQGDHTPDKSASLFKPVGFAGNGTPIWTQPLGAQDAYAEGAVVSCGGKTWTSTVSGNVWEPGVYGWEEA